MASNKTTRGTTDKNKVINKSSPRTKMTSNHDRDSNRGGIAQNGTSARGKNKTRVYTKASKDKIVKFASKYATTGNGTASARYAYPELADSSDKTLATKANRLINNDEVQLALGYIDSQLKRGAILAVDKIIKLSQSDNDNTSFKASSYLLDHTIGKPISRTETKQISINIESILE